MENSNFVPVIKTDNIEENKSITLINQINSTQPNKRKFAEIDESIKNDYLTQQPKLWVKPDIPLEDMIGLIYPPNIPTIVGHFLAVLTADFFKEFEYSSDSQEENDYTYSQHTPREYTCATLSLPACTLDFCAWSLELLYQDIAHRLIKDESVITLMEYLLSQHYDWNKIGNRHETLLHYLITLPDSLLALDKFDVTTQVKLLTEYYDDKGNSPLIILAKLYVENFEKAIYKNLKDCFDIIPDFACIPNNTMITSIDIDDATRSAFEIILDYSDRAFAQDESTLNNYLEILALMCVRTADSQAKLKLVKRFFDGLQIDQIYYDEFDKYYTQYAKSLLVDEQALKHENINDDHEVTHSAYNYGFFCQNTNDKINDIKHETVVLNNENSDSHNFQF